jgi:Flp pilus assembly protein TadG
MSILAPVFGVISRFRRAREGQVAVMFSILALPLTVIVGVAIDHGRVVSARNSLQSGLDAGLLASVAASDGLNAATMTEKVRRFIEANTQNKALQGLDIKLTIHSELRVMARADACIQLVFGGFLGKEHGCFAVDSEAQGGKTHLEVALVLDNTGSMDTSSDRIGNLRAAATQLVNVLEKNLSGNRTLQIALVPFVTAVNVKGDGFDWSWIDRKAENPLHGNNFVATGPGRVNHFTLFDQLQVPWKGCVEARPAPYNLTDAPPDAGDPGTLFVPYFAPDEPGKATGGGNSGTSFNNSYLNDGVTGSHAFVQSDISKYANALPRPVPIVEVANVKKGGMNLTNGPNRACPTPILPLTKDFDRLRTEIDAMRHWNGSGTNVSEGLMWGWRVLSPEAPYTGGRPFNDSRTQKVIVLLTDGENVVFGSSNTMNGSDYNSYGFLSLGRFGSTNRTIATRNVDAWTLQACNTLKNMGVLIYTITLEAGTPANKKLYGDCATTPIMYTDSPSAAQLGGIFDGIARQLVSLRLSQ